MGNDDHSAAISNALKTFGHRELRPLQNKIIRHVLNGGSGLALLPTGGGKSLCYQLPGICLNVTLVVSPLIALISEQVDTLRRRGVDARSLTSSLDKSSADSIYRELRKPEPSIKLLYVTPERVGLPAFAEVLKDLHRRGKLSLFAIDEAHCISSWGVSFRPMYRRLEVLRTAFPDVPLLALTATATANVVKDIQRTLKLQPNDLFRASFDRPNIRLSVRFKDVLGSALYQDLGNGLQRWLRKEPGASAIVYCRRRQDCEEAAQALSKQGLKTGVYHAGLNDTLRRSAQEHFTDGSVRVMCATVAFGMGIDKKDVRVVAHMSLPQSLDAFQQESGRAGRDGKASESIVYYSRRDAKAIQFLISKEAQEKCRREAQGSNSGEDVGSKAEAAAERDLEHLQKVVEYCELADGCRRRLVLKHFGETLPQKQRTSEERKACCDYCQDGGETVSASLRSMLLAESSGGSSSRWGRSQRGQDEADGEGGWEYDGGGDDDEEDEEEEEDPEVARALLTTSTAFKKHAQRMAPAQQVSKAARALAVIDTYVAVEEELEGRGKSHRPPGRGGNQDDQLKKRIHQLGKGLKRPRPAPPSKAKEEEESEEEDDDDDMFTAVDEEDEPHGVSGSRRRKIIQRLYDEGKRSAPRSAWGDVLKEIKRKEHEWISGAKSKDDYKAMVRQVMESL